MTDGLLNKHELLRAVIDTDWATRLDIRVSSHIIDRYFAKHKNARASLSYLEQATRTDRKNIRDSVRRLTDHRVFWVVREGAGTRPTEYGLNFAFGAREGTATPSISVGTATPTSEGTATPSSDTSVGTATPQTHLPVPVTKPVTGIDGTMCPAPLAGGLTATAAGAGGGEFETLWRAYGYRKEKAKAREQFAKLEVQDFGSLINAANAWREAWEAQGKSDAPRRHLHVWLRDEDYDCDPPTAFRPKERKQREPRPAAKPKTDVAHANDNGGSSFHRAPTRIPSGRYRAVIVDSQVESEPGWMNASLHIDIGSNAFTLNVALENDDYEEQAAGQSMLSNLCDALDLRDVDDSNELHNIPFNLEVAAGGALRFHSISAAA